MAPKFHAHLKSMSLMPTFLLIRHGENDFVKKGRMAGRLPGVHLNERGQEQAQALAHKLSGAPIKAVYSSPLERAVETAAPIAAALSLEIQLRDGLLETDIGEWQGLTWKSLRRLKIWRTVQSSPSLMRFPGGESFADSQYRISNEIKAICGEHEAKDLIACITHADPIKLAVAYFIGLPLDNFQRLMVAPASITILHVGENSSHLVNLNFDPSLNYSKP
jgi:probable phosphoglycerate mutase